MGGKRLVRRWLEVAQQVFNGSVVRALRFGQFLCQCRDPVLRREVLYLQLDSLAVQSRILRLKLLNIFLDVRMARLEQRLQIGRFDPFGHDDDLDG